MKHAILELCLANPDDSVAAAEAGVDRIELNAALELGGLTPTLAMLREVRASVTIPIIAMARPRPGGFCYTPREWRVMLRDAEVMLANGADGIAFGALDRSKCIDIGRCQEMVHLVGEGEVVFHRAFDVTPDPLDAMEALIDVGVSRILTSGQAASAPEGADVLCQLVEAARGRIEILPGSGIRPGNVRELIERTGCTQVHASLSRPANDDATGTGNGVVFGGHVETDIDQVHAMIAALRDGL